MVRRLVLMCSVMIATNLAIPARSVSADDSADIEDCAFLIMEEASLEAELDTEMAVEEVIRVNMAKNALRYELGEISYETYQANLTELEFDLEFAAFEIDLIEFNLSGVETQLAAACS